jgi:hypothetical protein
VIDAGGADGGREVDRADHHKHMDYVQAVISRLANNSFVMKGWALTLSSALLGFAASQGHAMLAFAAVAPAMAFWLLDTYFLRQERAFRDMFDDIASKKVTNFEIKPAPYAKRQSWWLAGKSISLSAFYGAIVALCLVVATVLAIAETADASPKSQDGCVNVDRPR